MPFIQIVHYLFYNAPDMICDLYTSQSTVYPRYKPFFMSRNFEMSLYHNILSCNIARQFGNALFHCLDDPRRHRALARRVKDAAPGPLPCAARAR